MLVTDKELTTYFVCEERPFVVIVENEQKGL